MFAILSICVMLFQPMLASAKCGGVDYSWGADALSNAHDFTVSVSAILSCRPFFILIFLPCIKMNHYGFSRKSIWKNLETFP